MGTLCPPLPFAVTVRAVVALFKPSQPICSTRVENTLDDNERLVHFVRPPLPFGDPKDRRMVPAAVPTLWSPPSRAPCRHLSRNNCGGDGGEDGRGGANNKPCASLRSVSLSLSLFVAITCAVFWTPVYKHLLVSLRTSRGLVRWTPTYIPLLLVQGAASNTPFPPRSILLFVWCVRRQNSTVLLQRTGQGTAGEGRSSQESYRHFLAE